MIGLGCSSISPVKIKARIRFAAPSHMFRLLLFFTFLSIFVDSSSAWAEIETVTRSTKAFDKFRQTENVRVQGVKVVIANYELIARDFPAQARAVAETEAAWITRVDQWLIQETGFILKQQAQSTETNTPIQTTAEIKTAIRPYDYNRAHVMPVDGGMMDAKGVGTENPSFGGHSDGLASLGEMLREFLFERLVTRILKFENDPARTVGNYAVLDFGFNVRHADGSESRAGYILRQAHVRSNLRNSAIPVLSGYRLEKLFRKYGLTSSGETMKGLRDWDYFNIQGTKNWRSEEILDFGAFMVVNKFSRRIIRWDHLTTMQYPSSYGFVQPQPALQIPLEMWGDFGNHDPKDDRPWRWSHDLAEAIAAGRADRRAVEQHIANFMTPVEVRLPIRVRASCAQIFAD
jgi:hypothetical protein